MRNDAARPHDDIAAIKQQHVRVNRDPPHVIPPDFVARRPFNASVVAQRRLEVALDRRQAPYANQRARGDHGPPIPGPLVPRRRPVRVDGFEGHDRLIVQDQSIRRQGREEASFDGVQAPRAPDDHVVFRNFDARVLGAYP